MSTAEQACTYASLILLDDGIEITVRRHTRAKLVSILADPLWRNSEAAPPFKLGIVTIVVSL